MARACLLLCSHPMSLGTVCPVPTLLAAHTVGFAPSPFCFNLAGGCRSQAKMLSASFQGCSLFSCCFLQGDATPGFLPAGCEVLEVCQPQTVTQQISLPINKAAPRAIPQFPHPYCHRPIPGYHMKDLWLWLGAEKKIHQKPIYITVTWCFTLLYTPESGLGEQVPRAFYGEGPNLTSKGARSVMGMI